MSRYSGVNLAEPSTWASYGRGARARVRALKRLEAEERNAKTPRDRTKQWRRDRAKVRAAIDEAHSPTTTGGTA
jgi:hypothetical protein